MGTDGQTCLSVPKLGTDGHTAWQVRTGQHAAPDNCMLSLSAQSSCKDVHAYIYDLPSSSLAYSSLITYLASSRFPHYVLRGGIPGPESDHEADIRGAGSTEGNTRGAPPFPQGLYTVPAATEHARSVNLDVDIQSECIIHI